MLALAGIAYVFCARACCRALFPKGFATGIAGASFLETAVDAKADLRQMQATASAYFDAMHERNLPTLEAAAGDVKNAIDCLMAEIVLSAAALVVTLVWMADAPTSPTPAPASPMPAVPPSSVIAVEIRSIKPR